MPVPGAGGYVRLLERAWSASRHPLLPQRSLGDGGPVEGIVDPVLVLQAYHLVDHAADPGPEQRGRRSKIAVTGLLAGRYLPAAQQVEGTIGLDHRHGQRLGAAA